MTAARRPGSDPGPTSKAEIARQVTAAALDELAEQLASGNSAQLDAYLRAMGNFHNYSFGNVMLIVSQNPEATKVAGYRAWCQLGRHVKRGEKGIIVIAPMMIKPKDRQALPGNDDPEKVLRFRAVHVFDISQTEGDALPDLDRTQGDPGDMLDMLEHAVCSSEIELEDAEDLGGADGVSIGGKIRIRTGLTHAERFSVLAHEWAHELLHKAKGEDRPSKLVRETEAEAVAFVVCHSIGLATGTAAADYIRLYRGDKETLLASMDRVQKTASLIIRAITDDAPEHAPVQTTQLSHHEHARQR